MGAIRALRKLRALDQNLVQLVEDSLTEMNDFLVQLNIEQLTQGLDSKNVFLGNYRESTHLIKESKGRPALGAEISLHDTGDFWRGITTNIVGNSLIMESTDWKESMLIKEFGQFIIGIPEDEMKTKVADKLHSTLMPKIINLLENA